jgi:hypothetical protein
VTYFGNIYKDPEGANLAKIVKVCRFFPQLVNNELNEALFSKMSMGEVEGVLSLM